VARCVAARRCGGRIGGHGWRRSCSLVRSFVVGGQHGRQFAGAEISEEIDQRIEDAEQRQTDPQPEHPHDHTLVTPCGDGLAHLVEHERQIGIGVKRDGVGQKI
jgi:hypothetical protein